MYLNIIRSAEAAVHAWYSIVRLLADPTANVTAVAEKLAPLYLPTYTSFTLGNATPRNRSSIIEGAASQFQHARDIGLGTDVKLLYSRIEPVSNESALCWLTLYICPPATSHVACWAYTEPFGYRIAADADNGLGGGWEFGIGDNEFESAIARFPAYAEPPK